MLDRRVDKMELAFLEAENSLYSDLKIYDRKW
jgi:hypothetical protein